MVLIISPYTPRENAYTCQFHDHNAIERFDPKTTYVVGRSALTAGTGTWQSVSVVIPPYTESRKLIARVIGVNNTAASGNFYADIDTLEKVLLKKKRIFI